MYNFKHILDIMPAWYLTIYKTSKKINIFVMHVYVPDICFECSTFCRTFYLIISLNKFSTEELRIQNESMNYRSIAPPPSGILHSHWPGP